MIIYIPHKRSDYYYSPIIHYVVTEDKTYFGSSGIWDEVPNDTELEDIVYQDDESLDEFLWNWFED